MMDKDVLGFGAGTERTWLPPKQTRRSLSQYMIPCVLASFFVRLTFQHGVVGFHNGTAHDILMFKLVETRLSIGWPERSMK